MGSDNNSLSPKLDHLEVSKNQQVSKKRKDIGKRVVEVKIGRKNGMSIGKIKNEGPPSDSWSWRKYGQKPIKGSPYPRGYYRCSTSKGCSAKKQVERCKTDDSLLIITYTSSHNHPGPHDQDQDQQISSALDHDHDHDDHGHIDIKNDTTIITSDVEHIHNRSSSSFEDIIVNVDTLTSATNSINALDKEVISNFSSSSPRDENDFFDELEELPTHSKFESFVRTQLYDEIRNYNPVVPSLI